MKYLNHYWNPKIKNLVRVSPRTELMNPIHLDKGLLQMMKEPIDSDRNRHKINQTLFPNIQFDNLPPVPPPPLVDRMGVFHILPVMQWRTLQNLWAAATDSTPRNHIWIAFQRYRPYSNYRIRIVDSITLVAASNAEPYMNLVFIRLPIDSFDPFFVPRNTELDKISLSMRFRLLESDCFWIYLYLTSSFRILVS